MDEIEVMEMAEERAHFTPQEVHTFMRKVMASSPCLGGDCQTPVSMLVVLKEHEGEACFTYHYPMCREHWLESRAHPSYHTAEEL